MSAGWRFDPKRVARKIRTREVVRVERERVGWCAGCGRGVDEDQGKLHDWQCQDVEPHRREPVPEGWR